jgi:hypothetical protein
MSHADPVSEADADVGEAPMEAFGSLAATQ